jgi:hypothetical protein
MKAEDPSRRLRIVVNVVGFGLIIAMWGAHAHYARYGSQHVRDWISRWQGYVLPVLPFVAGGVLLPTLLRFGRLLAAETAKAISSALEQQDKVIEQRLKKVQADNAQLRSDLDRLKAGIQPAPTTIPSSGQSR